MRNERLYVQAGYLTYLFFCILLNGDVYKQNLIHKKFTHINSTRVTIHLNYIQERKKQKKIIINKNKIIAQITDYNTYWSLLSLITLNELAKKGY